MRMMVVIKNTTFPEIAYKKQQLEVETTNDFISDKVKTPAKWFTWEVITSPGERRFQASKVAADAAKKSRKRLGEAEVSAKVTRGNIRDQEWASDLLIGRSALLTVSLWELYYAEDGEVAKER